MQDEKCGFQDVFELLSRSLRSVVQVVDSISGFCLSLLSPALFTVKQGIVVFTLHDSTWERLLKRTWFRQMLVPGQVITMHLDGP